jgi:putative transposase
MSLPHPDYGDTMLIAKIIRGLWIFPSPRGRRWVKVMARQARMIIPGVPHHVTQRGNRRERIFLEPGDEAIYMELMRTRLERHGVACWAYCLMPNHVHFILTPTDETGHLFQARFGSAAMDEDHLMAAFRYLALNPVKAGLVAAAADWPWSSAGAHMAGRGTPYVDAEPAGDKPRR